MDTADRAVALTYDDGPHPEHTPRILDVLADHQASATFFVLTPAARAHPGILRRMLDEGHRIGLHGADHRSLLTMSTRAAVRAVAKAKDELEQLAGAPVTLYRPPYGHHTPARPGR
ncbi:polysaccharide deacetylase family protein [Nesterenkonia pannonica]|uniref:polysaccharide deacetylase family protein n=1 Tax=Nesterenkonia pannonica TaxID=1548602 RepID=UPI0021641CE3|nr:polysaccharide deacetylase family protein [Nesterenkonia pannonica]